MLVRDFLAISLASLFRITTRTERLKYPDFPRSAALTARPHSLVLFCHPQQSCFHSSLATSVRSVWLQMTLGSQLDLNHACDPGLWKGVARVDVARVHLSVNDHAWRSPTTSNASATREGTL